MAHHELVNGLELDRDAHVVAAGDGGEREVLGRVRREEEPEWHDELLAILDLIVVRDQTVAGVRRSVGIPEHIVISCTCISTLRTHERAAGLEGLVEAVASRVRAHQLVHNVEVLAGQSLDVVRADGERDLVDHRETHGLDPAPILASTRRRRRSRSGLLELNHQIDWTEQIGGLGHDKVDRGAEVGGILRVDVTQLHLEVGGAHVPHVGEVATRVVEEERILRTLVNLQLWCHRTFC